MLSALLLSHLLSRSLGGNPLVPNVGQADPHIHFWPETNTYYACAFFLPPRRQPPPRRRSSPHPPPPAPRPCRPDATHDYSPNNTGFYMTDWWVWSSPDLVSWTLADVLFPNATPAAPSDYGSCWATDGAHRKDPAAGAWEYFF